MQPQKRKQCEVDWLLFLMSAIICVYKHLDSVFYHYWALQYRSAIALCRIRDFTTRDSLRRTLRPTGPSNWYHFISFHPPVLVTSLGWIVASGRTYIRIGHLSTIWIDRWIDRPIDVIVGGAIAWWAKGFLVHDFSTVPISVLFIIIISLVFLVRNNLLGLNP